MEGGGQPSWKEKGQWLRLHNLMVRLLQTLGALFCPHLQATPLLTQLSCSSKAWAWFAASPHAILLLDSASYPQPTAQEHQAPCTTPRRHAADQAPPCTTPGLQAAHGPHQRMHGIKRRAWHGAASAHGTHGLRAFCTTSPAAGKDQRRKARLVFLGTPEFAALVLRDLCEASRAPEAGFEVVAVVSRGQTHAPNTKPKSQAHPSQPTGAATGSAATGRAPAGGTAGAVAAGATHVQVTPVIREAVAQGLQPNQLLCPVSAKEAWFLDTLRALQPDLCVTAAYGNMLPQRFLDTPRMGTVNIHPSLLPKYRGAAPVVRCLLDGCQETGVSLALTVLKCDAGPVVAQQAVQVGPEEQAPDLTHRLFRLGSALLLQQLPGLLSGEAQRAAVQQVEAEATHAAKLTKEDALLDLARPAQQVHDQVRALAGWPGTRATFMLEPAAAAGSGNTGSPTPLDIKIIRTRVITHATQLGVQPPPNLRDHLPPVGEGQARLPGLVHTLASQQVSCVNGHAVVPCGGGTWLELVEVRYSKRDAKGDALTGQNFMAGLARRRLWVLRPGGGPTI